MEDITLNDGSELQGSPVSPALPLSDEVILDDKGRLTVRCDCNKVLKVARFQAGKTVVCPACRNRISVPAMAEKPQMPTSEGRHEGDALIEKVKDELKCMDAGEKKSIGKNIATLAISIFLFISFGLFRNSISGIALIVGVIFIHECGHFIGMKLFKYSDVQMFFIPLFGAAVAGKETAPSGLKKAMVALLGPLPGILIGWGTGFAYIRTRDPIFADATRTFLFLNAFNLLPFHPLDGGQFVDAALFSRHPKLEIGFKILTTLALGWLAVIFRDVFFGVFAFIVFLSLKGTHITASIAHSIRKELDDCPNGGSTEDPNRQLKEMIILLKEKIPIQHQTPKLFATYVNGIYERMRNKACSVGATIGLLMCYSLCIIFGMLSVLIFEGVVYAVTQREKENVEQSPEPY